MDQLLNALSLENVLLAAFGVVLGFGIYALLAMLIVPLFISSGLFVNKPDGLQRSGFHLFTNLAPGQVKIIVRGDRPVRMIMNTAGKKFARSGTERDASAYWAIEDGPSEDPTSDINKFFRPWAKMVYNATGYVFTGIYPFQRVYEYELERTVIQRNEDSTKKGGSNLVLTVKRDLSDHFRTRQFLFPMHITEAETNDKIPLNIIGTAEMQVENPHLAAFGTDRWDQAVINLVTDAITSETKQMTLDQALTAGNVAEAQRINTAVTDIKADEIECGIQINAFRVLEINPALDADGLKAIQAQAIAIQKAKATRVDGDARADALRAVNKANVEGGEHSIATMEAEALIRAAEAAGKGGGTVILTPQQGKNSGGTDSTQIAILAELRKLNQSKGGK